jgi:HPr Serine kinase C-terminal domain
VSVEVHGLTDPTSVSSPIKEYFYTAYGVNISSTFALPELVVSQATQSDVFIYQKKLVSSPLKIDSCDHCYQLTSDGMYLFWKDVGTFLIREGKEIIVDPLPHASEDRLRLFILGSAISVLLHQQGYLILHGSSVVINGKAVVFVGSKGWGKSTTAAALHKRGHKLLADDVVALDMRSEGEPLVLSAFPQLKLWPDAITSLGQRPEEVPYLLPHLEKRNNLIQSGFMQTAAPLQKVYVLGDAQVIEIRAMKPQEVIQDLLCHSYVARFGRELLRQNEASHLFQLTELAKRVSISYLLKPISLSLLSEIAKRVETDCGENHSDNN